MHSTTSGMYSTTGGMYSTTSSNLPTVEDITRAQVLTLFSRCNNDVPTMMRTMGRCLQEIGRTDVRVEVDLSGAVMSVAQNGIYGKRTSTFQQQIEAIAAEAKSSMASYQVVVPYSPPVAPGAAGSVQRVPTSSSSSAQPQPSSAGAAATSVSPLGYPLPAPYNPAPLSTVGVAAVAVPTIPPVYFPPSPPPQSSLAPTRVAPPLLAPLGPNSSTTPAPVAGARPGTSALQPVPSSSTATAPAPQPKSNEAKKSKVVTIRRAVSSCSKRCFPDEDATRQYPCSKYNGNYQLRRYGGEFPAHCNYGFYRRIGAKGQGAATAEFHNSPLGKRPERQPLYI